MCVAVGRGGWEEDSLCLLTDSPALRPPQNAGRVRGSIGVFERARLPRVGVFRGVGGNGAGTAVWRVLLLRVGVYWGEGGAGFGTTAVGGVRLVHLRVYRGVRGSVGAVGGVVLLRCCIF